MGKRFLSFVCGSRGTATGKKLWQAIQKQATGVVYSDYWKSYTEFVPPEQHMQSKAQTFTVEGYNSRIRHYLARFKRKTKSYSKQIHMLEKSLTLLFLKLNNQLTTLI